LTQEERLTNNRRQDGHVHGVADITICTADDEALGGATGAGVPSPSVTNCTNDCMTTSSPAASRIIPSPRMDVQYGVSRRTRQPVNNRGTRPQTTPGPTMKNIALPTAATPLRTITRRFAAHGDGSSWSR
jgi:hypothetical protein